jgi:hypothetical protein
MPRGYWLPSNLCDFLPEADGGETESTQKVCVLAASGDFAVLSILHFIHCLSAERKLRSTRFAFGRTRNSKGQYAIRAIRVD